VAIDNAVEKLKALGPSLGPPHSSGVLGWEDLRELRPKQGASPWRPPYRQVGEAFGIAAIGPAAKKNKRGFDQAGQAAIDRLAELEEEDGEETSPDPGEGSGESGGRDSG